MLVRLTSLALHWRMLTSLPAAYPIHFTVTVLPLVSFEVGVADACRWSFGGMVVMVSVDPAVASKRSAVTPVSPAVCMSGSAVVSPRRYASKKSVVVRCTARTDEAEPPAADSWSPPLMLSSPFGPRRTVEHGDRSAVGDSLVRRALDKEKRWRLSEVVSATGVRLGGACHDDGSLDPTVVTACVGHDAERSDRSVRVSSRTNLVLVDHAAQGIVRLRRHREYGAEDEAHVAGLVDHVADVWSSLEIGPGEREHGRHDHEPGGSP